MMNTLQWNLEELVQERVDMAKEKVQSYKT